MKAEITYREHNKEVPMQPTDFQTEEQVASYFTSLINPALKAQNWNTVLTLTEVFMQPNSHEHFASIGQSDMMTRGMYQRALALALTGQLLQSNQLLIICRPRFVEKGEIDMVKEVDELFVNNNMILNSKPNLPTPSPPNLPMPSNQQVKRKTRRKKRKFWGPRWVWIILFLILFAIKLWMEATMKANNPGS